MRFSLFWMTPRPTLDVKAKAGPRWLLDPPVHQFWRKPSRPLNVTQRLGKYTCTLIHNTYFVFHFPNRHHHHPNFLKRGFTLHCTKCFRKHNCHANSNQRGLWYLFIYFWRGNVVFCRVTQAFKDLADSCLAAYYFLTAKVETKWESGNVKKKDKSFWRHKCMTEDVYCVYLWENEGRQVKNMCLYLFRF